MRSCAYVQTGRYDIIRSVTEPIRPEDLRVSDAERASTERVLRRAHDAGQLDLSEYDERVRAVWAARTRGDLQRITADLPEPPEPPSEPASRWTFAPTPGGTAMKVLAIIWACLAAANVSTWSVLKLTTAPDVYPWWVWVAVPPGAVLAVLFIAGVGRPRRE